MNNVPDWLWQGLTIWATGKGIEWAWHHRGVILDKWQPVLLSAASGGSSDMGATLTVDKSVSLQWNVEASTPTLARRLEELASWYLHVS